MKYRWFVTNRTVVALIINAYTMSQAEAKEYTARIIETSYLTDDVKRFVIERPAGYTFVPGQAMEMSISKEGWKNEKRPFTFTGLPDWDNLELIIKIYDSHKGVTHELSKLLTGDELLIGDPWGAISYKGKGVFIAGGAGITPFISIFRDLERNGELQGNRLIFSNKTAGDVILDSELTRKLGSDFIKVFTREKVIGYIDRRIDKDLLIENISNFSQHFYICGPDAFVKGVSDLLVDLGANADAVIFEK
jgi:ferredoxin-NADP reductase